MTFFERVYEIVRKIPRGKVVSYGQIAVMLDSPRSARQVGFAMNAIPKTKYKDIPWWRVINSKGFISIKNEDPNSKFIQRDLLERDGVDVSEDLIVDMKKYQWTTA